MTWLPRFTAGCSMARANVARTSNSLGRQLLAKIATVVTPDTILRWQRKLIAKHHAYPHKNRVGRPGLMKSIRELIVRMANENSGWGYKRIRDEPQKAGHIVARTTIAKAPKDNGIAPSPDRPTSWRTFLKSHADVIAATDFYFLVIDESERANSTQNRVGRVYG